MIRGTIFLLCVVGVYASAFMYRKSVRASRCQLTEPSVVETQRARVLGGIPNSAFGLAYYATLAVALRFLHSGPVWSAAFGASLAAAAFSAYLGYSLLFVTRRPCPYCWTSHAINFVLPPLLLLARPH